MNTLSLTPQQFESLKPVIDAQARQQAADLFERRTALVRELEALGRTEKKEMTPLELRAAENLSRFEAAERAYAEARQAAETAAAMRERARFDFGHRRDRLTNELWRTAPGEIATLESELRDRLRVLPDELVGGERGTGELTFSAMLGRFVHQRTSASNAGELGDRLAAIRAALAELETLRMKAVEPAELAERLDEIRRECLA